jgi:hypothetical protein
LNLRPLGPEPETDDPWGSLLIPRENRFSFLADHLTLSETTDHHRTGTEKAMTARTEQLKKEQEQEKAAAASTPAASKAAAKPTPKKP